MGKVAVLVLMALASGLLCGCGASTTAGADNDTLHTAMRSDVQSFDPAIVSDVEGMTYLRLLYECLLDYGDGTDLVPWLAEEVPAPSADGKSYTFHIKKNVCFTNGRAVTAEDFVYAVDRVLDPKTKSPGDGYYRGIQGAQDFIDARVKESKSDPDRVGRWIAPLKVEGLQAMDTYTLRIDLEKPDAAFLYTLTMPFSAPVPRETVERLSKEEFSRQPDGTGPYVLAEWHRGARIRFERKPTHHMNHTKAPAAIAALIGPDDFTQQMMFERGQLDLMYRINPPDYVRISRDPHWRECLHSLPMNEVGYIALNCEMEPFTDRRVRQALNYAIDKERVLKLMNYRATLAKGVLPPLMPGYNPQLRGYSYDPDKAKQLLTAAGYPDGFTMPLSVYTDADYRVKICQSVQHDLKKVGINVELNLSSYVTFEEAVGTRKRVKACIFGWVQDYPDPSDFLDILLGPDSIKKSRSQNLAFYSNPDVDALLQAAGREAADPQKRLRLYQQAEQLVVDDAPWVFLFHPMDYRLVQPWVRGFHMHPVWQVRFDYLWLERP